MTRKKQVVNFLLGEKNIAMYSSQTQDGVTIGSHKKGQKKHLTAYATKDLVDIHVKDEENNAKKQFVKSTNPILWKKNLETELAGIIGSDEVFVGPFYELKAEIVSELSKFDYATNRKETEHDLGPFYLFLLAILKRLKENGAKDFSLDFADFSKPVLDAEIGNHKWLSDGQGNLLYTHKKKVYRMTVQKMKKMLNFMSSFGAIDIIKQIDPEADPLKVLDNFKEDNE